jgi:hypothetical protein
MTRSKSKPIILSLTPTELHVLRSSLSWIRANGPAHAKAWISHPAAVSSVGAKLARAWVREVPPAEQDALDPVMDGPPRSLPPASAPAEA